MAGSKNDLKDRLIRYHQIKISVIGRKSGQTISIPVWFVLDGVKSVVEKFREKYGAKDVKKYYSKFDVGVVIDLD